MKEEPFYEKFWENYNRLRKGRGAKASTRNFETLAMSYFEIEQYKKLKPRTQKDYRKYIEQIRKTSGNRDHQRLETHQIHELQCENADR